MEDKFLSIENPNAYVFVKWVLQIAQFTSNIAIISIVPEQETTLGPHIAKNSEHIPFEGCKQRESVTSYNTAIPDFRDVKYKRTCNIINIECMRS